MQTSFGRRSGRSVRCHRAGQGSPRSSTASAFASTPAETSRPPSLLVTGRSALALVRPGRTGPRRYAGWATSAGSATARRCSRACCATREPTETKSGTRCRNSTSGKGGASAIRRLARAAAGLGGRSRPGASRPLAGRDVPDPSRKGPLGGRPGHRAGARGRPRLAGAGEPGHAVRPVRRRHCAWLDRCLERRPDDPDVWRPGSTGRAPPATSASARAPSLISRRAAHRGERLALRAWLAFANRQHEGRA